MQTISFELDEVTSQGVPAAKTYKSLSGKPFPLITNVWPSGDPKLELTDYISGLIVTLLA